MGFSTALAQRVMQIPPAEWALRTLAAPNKRRLQCTMLFPFPVEEGTRQRCCPHQSWGSSGRRSVIWGACSISPSRHILHDLPSSPRTLSGCAFHKALELDRAMFARKVNGSLAHSFIATEVGILSNTPAGVTAKKKRVAGGIAQRRLAGIMGADAREDRLQLLEAVLGILLEVWGVISRGVGRRWRICGSSVSARIIDKQPT